MGKDSIELRAILVAMALRNEANAAALEEITTKLSKKVKRPVQLVIASLQDDAESLRALSASLKDLQRLGSEGAEKLSNLYDGYLDTTSILATEDDLIVEVFRLTRALLRTQECRIERIADLLGLNTRTLQRRLAVRGFEFEEITDLVRRRQAEQLLRNSDLSIQEIAVLLGYRRATSFGRAHRRWFGISPVEHRSRFLHVRT
ncbi:helix-turn-helix transcriptional regulator [Pseudomonas sp. NPDC086581]|uniref:helix-turn-helix transcriptional regulator n=1 Tax=Pseudomonas sp. NPDC086581 TaxID=3364432 RepID=UPI003807030A